MATDETRASYPTLQGLVRDIVDEWKDLESDDLDMEWLDEVSTNAVPCMTTVLFGMVVQDNSLAFLDCPSEVDEPFRCLAWAIGAEVERLARREIESIKEDANGNE